MLAGLASLQWFVDAHVLARAGKSSREYAAEVLSRLARIGLSCCVKCWHVVANGCPAPYLMLNSSKVPARAGNLCMCISVVIKARWHVLATHCIEFTFGAHMLAYDGNNFPL